VDDMCKRLVMKTFNASPNFGLVRRRIELMKILRGNFTNPLNFCDFRRHILDVQNFSLWCIKL
jgi:hypothetical protein